MTNEETIEVLDDMKIKIDIPKSAITQRNRNEALDKAIKAIEQTSWIPCSERLPEENGNYLVTVEANDGTASIKFQMVDHYGPKWLHEGKHEKVIAWMPLPEPYKTESEE